MMTSQSMGGVHQMDAWTGSRDEPSSSPGVACGWGFFPTPERLPPPSFLSEFLQPRSLLLLRLLGRAPNYREEAGREGGSCQSPLPVCFVPPTLSPEGWEVNMISAARGEHGLMGSERSKELPKGPDVGGVRSLSTHFPPIRSPDRCCPAQKQAQAQRSLAAEQGSLQRGAPEGGQQRPGPRLCLPSCLWLAATSRGAASQARSKPGV